MGTSHPGAAISYTGLVQRLRESVGNLFWSSGDRFSSQRTRFAIVDDVLPADWAYAIHEAFDVRKFRRQSSFRERKSTSSQFDEQPQILGDICRALQHGDLVDLVSRSIGFQDLECDPSHYAGGLSMMAEGDFLNPHVDNSHDGIRRCFRRLNLLYYVTPDWTADCGGHLELWDPNVVNPLTVEARFNRLVLMETNRTSWHSVSKVLVDRPRCCASVYYFSRRSPEPIDYYHVTSFTGRPEQRIRRFISPIDNGVRTIVRHLGGGRRADRGYVPR